MDALVESGPVRPGRPEAAEAAEAAGPRATATVKTINLALQGGGSHGAFAWGVLDRLLQEPWLSIEAVSGTSAGQPTASTGAPGAERTRGSSRSVPNRSFSRS